MGCDVHIHAEVKIKGKWHHYDQPDCHRDYALFERMAGVRGDVKEAIAPPRGLPDDATEMTRFCCDYEGGDGHSHSWLSAVEIDELEQWDSAREIQPRSVIGPEWDRFLFGNCYSDFNRSPEENRAGIEDVRFIFWFDN